MNDTKFSENSLWSIFRKFWESKGSHLLYINSDRLAIYIEPSDLNMNMYMYLFVVSWNLIMYMHMASALLCSCLYYDFVHRFPGRFVIVRTMIKFGSMLCYGSRDLAIGPGSVYGVMLWYGLWYVWWYDMLCSGCTEIWNLPELCCVWHQRRSGDHVPERYAWFRFALYVYVLSTGLIH